jgi:hypothetical protein
MIGEAIIATTSLWTSDTSVGGQNSTENIKPNDHEMRSRSDLIALTLEKAKKRRFCPINRRAGGERFIPNMPLGCESRRLIRTLGYGRYKDAGVTTPRHQVPSSRIVGQD